MKGFYPAGGAEFSDAIQAALRIKSGGRVLVPIRNWAAFGGSKEVIIWLPIDMIAETVAALVALSKQVIDDIYQIMGLSDIMRGATDARRRSRAGAQDRIRLIARARQATGTRPGSPRISSRSVFATSCAKSSPTRR